MVIASKIELLALKKLAVISHTLAFSLSDEAARKEQLALTSVLVDVTNRLERAAQAQGGGE